MLTVGHFACSEPCHVLAMWEGHGCTTVCLCAVYISHHCLDRTVQSAYIFLLRSFIACYVAGHNISAFKILVCMQKMFSRIEQLEFITA